MNTDNKHKEGLTYEPGGRELLTYDLKYMQGFPPKMIEEVCEKLGTDEKMDRLSRKLAKFRAAACREPDLPEFFHLLKEVEDE